MESGRGLMGRPWLRLLDVPSLGLAPTLVGEVMAALAQLHCEGLTLLLVEQNAQAALEIADRGYVLEAGQLTLQGPAQELLANPSLRAPAPRWSRGGNRGGRFDHFYPSQ